MRRLRWLPAVVLVPLGASLWLLLISFWFGIWGAANAAIAVRDQSLPALGRAVEGAARAAGVASWVATGWGSLAHWAPPLQPVADAGTSLEAIADAGLALAPALPGALGMDGPRSYLFCGLNDAELLGSGGMPLSAMVVRFDRTGASIPVSGSVSRGINPGNVPYQWDTAGGLPWYRAGARYSFVSSGRHPDFRLAGRNMRIAWNTLDLPPVDGVIAVDVEALAAVLSATGPVTVDGFPEATADNAVQLLLVDAYRSFPEWDEGADYRRDEWNGQLQSEVIDRLRDPRTALKAAHALWEVIPYRHVQANMADPALQAVVSAIGADGALSVPSRDVLGVFSQSAPSKLAVFQKQRIERLVEVEQDGSARVTQRVVFTNAVPAGLPGDRSAHRGYLALKYRQRVAYRVPASATQSTIAVENSPALVQPGETGPFPDGAGAVVLWQGQDIGPGLSGATSLAYVLPPGTFGGDGDLRYVLTADSQARVEPATLEVTVVFPEGSRPVGEGPGWSTRGTVAHWSGALERSTELVVHGRR